MCDLTLGQIALNWIGIIVKRKKKKKHPAMGDCEDQTLWFNNLDL